MTVTLTDADPSTVAIAIAVDEFGDKALEAYLAEDFVSHQEAETMLSGRGTLLRYHAEQGNVPYVTLPFKKPTLFRIYRRSDIAAIAATIRTEVDEYGDIQTRFNWRVLLDT